MHPDDTLVAFKERDKVWIHLRKERFPNRNFPKLQRRANGPFKVLQRIGENAYKIELPGDYGVSTTFNVADLSLYLDDDELFDSRSSLVQTRENDEVQGGIRSDRSSSSDQDGHLDQGEVMVQT